MKRITSLEFLLAGNESCEESLEFAAAVVFEVEEAAAIDSKDFFLSAMVKELDLEAGLPNMAVMALVCCFEVTAASMARNSPMEVFFFITIFGGCCCCCCCIIGDATLSLEAASFSSRFRLLRLARLSQAVGTWLEFDAFEDGGFELLE